MLSTPAWFCCSVFSRLDSSESTVLSFTSSHIFTPFISSSKSSKGFIILENVSSPTSNLNISTSRSFSFLIAMEASLFDTKLLPGSGPLDKVSASMDSLLGKKFSSGSNALENLSASIHCLFDVEKQLLPESSELDNLSASVHSKFEFSIFPGCV
ncbi:unnamed protein product [Meganyctiphanes norvegica]|uniref:Uncharacterized protein n=1 Tax=Meganyctiphanes norvegica TaxID=48144 RepID=A0AAV2QBT3_MEGNR